MRRTDKVFLSVCLGMVIFFGGVWITDVSAYQFKWRLTQVMPVDIDQDLRAKAFAKEVKERTQGRIDITVHSAGVLCDWVECHERVMRGDFELALQSLAPNYKGSSIFDTLIEHALSCDVNRTKA